MQSLQMRWPVAAAIGLSTAMMPSAASGSPRAFTMWNSEIFSSSGQPASGTPNTVFLKLSGGRLFLQALRAGILALLVAPDAVVRLVERAGEIGAGVGEREAFAVAQVDPGHVRRRSRGGFGVHRDQPHEVELVRRLEQHAAAVLAPCPPA